MKRAEASPAFRCGSLALASPIGKPRRCRGFNNRTHLWGGNAGRPNNWEEDTVTIELVALPCTFPFQEFLVKLRIILRLRVV
jgi:hypothetical protein